MILVLICLVLLLLPPRFDPAIRIKEAQLARARASAIPSLSEKES